MYRKHEFVQHLKRYSRTAVCWFLLAPAMALSESRIPVNGSPEKPLEKAKTAWMFDFGPGPIEDGYTRITSDMMYNSERGFGFLDNAGISMQDRKILDALKTDFCTGEEPFLLSIDAPEEGNYRVTLTLGDAQESTATTVKAESRRLMLENIQTQPGEFLTRTIIVNVRNSFLPDGGKVRLKNREIGVFHWDNQLTLEFNGKRPCVCAVKIEKADDLPTIFLAGDSTVTDQTKEPWTSWGQMLTRFFKPEIAVANYAESGETLRAFVGEKRLAKLLTQLKAGDYLFIQFAHNDMKRGTPEEIGYQQSLQQFIDEARKRDAHPVLVTSMHRRRFDDNGKVVDTMQGFPEAMKAVAEQQSVPLIDLHAMSRRFYEVMGPETSAEAFVDGTHHNAYGAYELAKCVVEGIKANVPELKRCLIDDLPAFDPAEPDPLDEFSIPASPMRFEVKPEGS
jgi:lysophospholipase L1-like esterase